jgi:hypothetical protein
MTLTGDGKVGIGTSIPSQRLEVAGTVRAHSFDVSSDKNFKKNIQPLRGSLNKVLQLQGVQYEWNTQDFPRRGFDTTIQDGFIAQDIEKVLPELVHKGADGYKAVDYIQLIPFLVEAIKEQQAQINSLKAQLGTKTK